MPGQVYIWRWKQFCLHSLQIAFELLLGQLARALKEALHKLWRFQRKLRQWPMLPCKLLRIFECAFEDEPGYWIDVDGSDLATQAHRLKGNCPATCEGIENLGGPSTVCVANPLPEPLQIWPRFSPPVENTAYRFLYLLLFNATARQLLFLYDLYYRATKLLQQLFPLLCIARVGQKCSNERSATRRQWPPGRPDVQGRDVPVTDVLLMDRVQRGLLEWECDFDQTIVHRVMRHFTWLF